MLERRVSLIGAGAMGEALVRSLVTRRLVEPQALMAADVRRSRLEEVARRYGVRAGASNEEAARFGEVLILAVKPQQIEGVLQEIRPHLTPHHLILSITSARSTCSSPVPAGSANHTSSTCRARCRLASYPASVSVAAARGSIGLPMCQEAVPALTTRTRSASPASAIRCSSTTCAIGERQMLPRQIRATV